MNQQLSGTEIANYPDSAFPNHATWRYDKKKDAGLNGYGTWDAIDVQFKEHQPLISAKKSRPVSRLTQEANSSVLSPLQDSVVLCDSSHTSDNFPVGCNNFVSKQLTSKIIDKKLSFTALPVENKFLNFVDGAPQVFYKEFKDFLKKASRDDSLRHWLGHILEKKLSQDTLLKHFDPTCFGAGRKLLSDLLQEDYKKSLTEEMNEGGTVGGGCLSYKDISKSGCKNLGILICAQGLGMDELSIKAIHADGASKIQLCGDISRTLNGRIQNINSATFAGDTMISAMSDYYAVVNNFHSDSIVFNWEEKKAQFSENSLCSTSGLSTSGDAPFSSVVINPYIQGECVVATKNGFAGIWRADRQSQNDSFNAVLRLNVCYAREYVSLKQISFGAHPRQFCGCDHYRTYLFDIRSQNSPGLLFDVENSPFLDKSEFIYSAQTCQSVGNEYEVIVATDNNIFLFDQRHPNQPLLQWDAASNFPASYLKCVRSTFDECTSDIQLSNSLVLAGGMTTDKVYYWQLNRLKTICSDGKYLCSPPYLAAPTRILNPLPIKHSTLSTKLASSVSSDTNFSYVNKGFDASVFDGARSKHVCIFQLTSHGEIFYQYLGKNDKTVESFQNFRSDGNSLISHDIISQSDIPTTSNSSKLMINNSNDAVNRCISSARGMKHCVICESESLNSSNVRDSNDDHDASLPTIFKSCKHRSLLDGSRIEYSIEDKYFHSTNDISQLNLIDTNSPSDASDMGRMLLESCVSQLVPPSREEITVCERNGKLVTITDPILVDAYLEGEIVTFPSVFINPDSLRRTAVIPGESAKAAFLDHKETVGQRLLSAWHENGVAGVLAELSQTDLISRFGMNRDWEDSPIRFLSWHQRANKFAVALRDDTVKIHYCNKHTVSVLKHKLQKNITCMEWRPLLATQLAVGTQAAILVWCIDPKSHSTRPSSGAVQVLAYKGHAPVTSIAWSPTGDDLLLATSAFSSALVVWSTALEEYQVIQHLTTSGGISRVVWSPDASKVMVSTPSSSFRVFETGTWTNERWSNLTGHVQCACWNPLGTVLLFALHGDAHVYSVVFPDPQVEGPSLAGCTHASVVLDLTVRNEASDVQDEHVQRTNTVHSMVWDCTGSRVAILFDDTDPRHNLVALFSTSEDPLFRIAPIGYIQGRSDSEPVFISFKPNYDLGACLTMCWSDGNISYLPIYLPSLDRNILKVNGGQLPTEGKPTPRGSESLWSRTASGSPYSRLPKNDGIENSTNTSL